MIDSPKDEKKFVPIFNKTTGVASRGEALTRGGHKPHKRPDAQASPPEAAPEALKPHRDTGPRGQRHASDTGEGSESVVAPNQKPHKISGTSTTSQGNKCVTRVFDIIQRFYASSGTPKKITEPALKKLEEHNLSDAQRSELLDLAQREDTALSRTVNLAFAAFETHSNRTIKDLLLNFTIDVGRKGFDLAWENVDAWLPLTDEERTPVNELFKRYASRVQQVEASKEVPAKEKKERLAKMRNLLFLSLVWQANQRWIKEEEVLRFLRTDGVFTTNTHYPTQAVEALLKAAYTQSSSDFSPMGWLSRQIENTKASQSNELERLQRDVERLATERVQAQEEIEALRFERDTLLDKTGELQQALQQEKQNARTASVHLEDDKHRLRSQVTKVLKSEVTRLDEALIALQREPPKLHIVSHYVEETREHLNKVLSDTEGE